MQPDLAPAHYPLPTILLLLLLSTWCAWGSHPSKHKGHPTGYQTTAFSCTSKDEELHLLYRENLEPDVAPWRERRLRMSDFDKAAEQFPQNDVRRVVLIHNNQLYFPLDADPTKCEEPCNRYMQDLTKAISLWNSTIRFPNVVALVSVHDHPKCHSNDTCAAPMLSISKEYKNHILGTSYDILFPKAPTRNISQVMEYPWERKVNKALWRGTRWCDGRPTPVVPCSRFYMWNLTQQANVSNMFDFRYTGGSTDTPSVAPHMDALEQAKYKFLLNVDGFTAAYRFSKLMLYNSVVLKEESTRIEYFYRSLQPFVHYLPFFHTNSTDLIDMVTEYLKPEHDAQLRAISKNAQAFAMRYACPNARMLYLRRVLEEYRNLFPDMDQAINDKWLPAVQAKLASKAQSNKLS